MNFDYLKAFPDMKKLHEYCSEAEEFALYKPSISATSARKAMEFIVKMIYASLVGSGYNPTVFEMVTDERFVRYVNDPTLINSIHYIRKIGNILMLDAAGFDLKKQQLSAMIQTLDSSTKLLFAQNIAATNTDDGNSMIEMLFDVFERDLINMLDLSDQTRKMIEESEK